MRNMNVSKEIAEYVKGRPEEVVTVDEIVADTGLSPEQARYAMRRLIEKSDLGKYISVASRGQVWNVGAIPGAKRKRKKEEDLEVVPPAAPHVGLRFEPVGTLKDGAYVVRSADGKLWKLTAL